VGSFNAAWVLVIEDLRDQAELWSDVCAEAGLNATTAANGVQGYQKACSSPPAIILLDVMLPDIDGWEVCRRLKTDERTKHIPIRLAVAVSMVLQKAPAFLRQGDRLLAVAGHANGLDEALFA
jgi:CheY-like chemotaxis protein